ncbi:hypothetical protein LC605_19930 [Nostoc sp. CHAB 5836]|nr:hypothetical protein [Nostoc sp. CHAB 5836]
MNKNAEFRINEWEIEMHHSLKTTKFQVSWGLKVVDSDARELINAAIDISRTEYKQEREL